MKRVASIVLTATLSLSAVGISVAWLYKPKPSCHASNHPGVVAPCHGANAAMTADVSAAALKGLWSRYPDSGKDESDPVAFYYFHDGGIGLYRYGRIGFNTTNSYTWKVGEHQGKSLLVLRYNKTGEVQHLRVSIDSAGRKTLIIEGDPKQPGEKASRYIYVPPPSQAPSTKTSVSTKTPRLVKARAKAKRVKAKAKAKTTTSPTTAPAALWAATSPPSLSPAASGDAAGGRVQRGESTSTSTPSTERVFSATPLTKMEGVPRTLTLWPSATSRAMTSSVWPATLRYAVLNADTFKPMRSAAMAKVVVSSCRWY